MASAFVLIDGGQKMGIPLTTLLAGAGVGGLTIALAAQDTLKNLFDTACPQHRSETEPLQANA